MISNEIAKQLNVDPQNTFDNFKPVDGAEKAFKLFKELATLPKWFMLLCYGYVGNGKTHLCDALSIKLYESRAIFCRVMEWSEMYAFIEYSKRVHFQEGDYFRQVTNNIKLSPMLILDDFDINKEGSGYKLEEEWNYFEDLIKYRYKNDLLTVVTTNLDIAEDKSNPKSPFIPPRIVSRFNDAVKSRKVLNSAADYRPLKGKD